MRISSVSRAYSDLQVAPVSGPVGRETGSIRATGSGRAFSGKLDGFEAFGIFDVVAERPGAGDVAVSAFARMAGVSATDICFILLEGGLTEGPAG